jgi:hypothetical protein
MVVVQVPTGVSACQIEFPEHQLDKRGKPKLDENKQPVPFGERSCLGALHLRPGSTKTITEPELEFIRASRPDLKLRVIASDVKASAPESAPSDDAAQTTVTTTAGKKPKASAGNE